MRKLRQLYRAFLARYFPIRFARWVNRERCQIIIRNDPSGLWWVTIGDSAEEHANTLGEAMLDAFWSREIDNEWKWTTDYLREMPDAWRKQP